LSHICEDSIAARFSTNLSLIVFRYPFANKILITCCWLLYSC